MTDQKRAFAAAKINLALHVLGQRSDGYHEIESLVAFVDIGDTLTAEMATTAEVRLGGRFGGQLASGQDNLVELAVAKFRKRFPGAIPQNLRFHLDKNLPIASGIGGGSADAAATLRLLKAFADQPISDLDLSELALELGADVPVCLNEQPTLMRGIGQILESAPHPPTCGVVLINPRREISTPQVFEQLNKRENPALPELPDNWSSQSHFVDWLETTRNDLAEPAIALEPEIAEITGFAEAREGALFARMSGSGATVWAIFETEKQAKRAAADATIKWPNYWAKGGEFLAKKI